MILGIGIDSVEINRFDDWHSYEAPKLQKIFTPREIEYCLSVSKVSAERFAARFAAKEAFYKAVGGFKPDYIIPFATMAPLIEIEKNPNGSVCIAVPWKKILHDDTFKQNIYSFVSLTHTRTHATAVIILEER